MTPGRRTLLLATGDAVAIVAFVMIGLASHDEGLTVTGIVRTAVPILAVWFAIAPFLGTYRSPGWRTMLPTWLAAVVGGLSLRLLIFHRPAHLGDFFVFLGVTLAFTLLLLTAWRLVAMSGALHRSRA